ncbi:FAD-binding oxidoreductase [uncultured Maritimibacter sp.]|jgi:glycine/D-amino acid oxidase-like deaminating enzyme|uniref:NAD(P)/FAD-dependent oxidoreductase n=1 Tax=uncultured Maritimibacter sp. TaxID=991866 RepID=UPI000B2FFB72|nr:FAD-binding oxidoreductase [uncultured Maritimibacter sp.]
MVDVTVLGAGAFGLSCAYACATRGARVRVIDPAGVGGGASGGVVGALAPHVPENWNPKKAFQFEALDQGATFWGGVEAIGGVAAGYARTGRLQPIADQRALELARARAVTAREFWQGQYVWEVVAAHDWGPVSATGLWVHDTLTARIAPHRACAALAAAVIALGGEVVREGVQEGAVIHATGAAGLAALGAHFGKPVGAAVKGQAAVLAYDARDLPQIFAETVHVIPHADGTVAIGSTSERDFADPATTDGQLDEVIARARAAVPALAEAPVVRRWAGLRPRARTRSPILGAWPDRPGHFVANGGFKIGFGIAPKVGAVLADLVLDGLDRVPDGFRVEDNL